MSLSQCRLELSTYHTVQQMEDLQESKIGGWMLLVVDRIYGILAEVVHQLISRYRDCRLYGSVGPDTIHIEVAEYIR